ncbi:hypothetical protein [Paraburkholderia bannensis]|uniref:hypothetical protein n=1 Tax=Paraburkholderia bannensis TaxID=765414 RepID=UPI002ABE3783|nr:hypothetical protein [Paraburkholderia bannensis]
MRWQDYLRQGHIVVQGQLYDLSHLLAANVEINIDGNGGFPARKITMHVEYLSHCVNVGARSKDEPLDFEVLGHSRRMIDHQRQERAFCLDRYRWSKQLPAVIASLNDEVCYFGKHANWLVVRVIDDEGKEVQYSIYFRMRKGDAAGTLRMVIESAYERGAEKPSPGMPKNRKSKMRFKIIAAKTLRGDAIRHPDSA